jgi:hypothetical protein
MNSDKRTDEDKIGALKKEIAELKSQWPAHSVPAAMLQRLEDLEDELREVMHETNDVTHGNHLDTKDTETKK